MCGNEQSRHSRHSASIIDSWDDLVIFPQMLSTQSLKTRDRGRGEEQYLGACHPSISNHCIFLQWHFFLFVDVVYENNWFIKSWRVLLIHKRRQYFLIWKELVVWLGKHLAKGLWPSLKKLPSQPGVKLSSLIMWASAQKAAGYQCIGWVGKKVSLLFPVWEQAQKTKGPWGTPWRKELDTAVGGNGGRDMGISKCRVVLVLRRKERDHLLWEEPPNLIYIPVLFLIHFVS